MNSSHSYPYLEGEFAFTNHKGVKKNSIIKMQTRLLSRIDGIMSNALHGNERVLFVTSAVSPVSIIEQLTMGWIIFVVKRCCLVFTDRRIIHLPMTSQFKPKAQIAEINYGDIAATKSRGGLWFEYKDGSKERFLAIKGWVRKKMLSIIQEKMTVASPSVVQKRCHLCPRCHDHLQDGIYRCKNCRLEFKDMATANKMSWLYPGGGYFYTGHPWLGIGDFFFEAMLLYYSLTLMIEASLLENADMSAFLWILSGLLGFGLLIEKLITIHHARHFIKEFIPKDLKAVQAPTIANNRTSQD